VFKNLTQAHFFPMRTFFLLTICFLFVAAFVGSQTCHSQFRRNSKFKNHDKESTRRLNLYKWVPSCLLLLFFISYLHFLNDDHDFPF